jgi:hypothetical protein
LPAALLVDQSASEVQHTRNTDQEEATRNNKNTTITISTEERHQPTVALKTSWTKSSNKCWIIMSKSSSSPGC